MMVHSMLVDVLFISILYKIHLDPINLNVQVPISRRLTNNLMFQTMHAGDTVKKDTHEMLAHNRYKVCNSCTHAGDFYPSHTFTILLVAFSMAHMQLAYSKIAHTYAHNYPNAL